MADDRLTSDEKVALVTLWILRLRSVVRNP